MRVRGHNISKLLTYEMNDGASFRNIEIKEVYITYISYIINT